MSLLALLVPALVLLPQAPASTPSATPGAAPAAFPAPRLPSARSLPIARINDNRIAAGTLRDGVLTLRLVVQWTSWTLNPETARDLPMLAFAEEGKPPQIPGPALRVPRGTRVRLSLRNPLPDLTVTLRGLGSHATDARDSLVIAPGATVEHEYVAEAEGTFFYWGTISGATAPVRRFGYDSQLNGALVVDAPGAPRDDRVFLISLWSDSTNADGSFNIDREFWAINGRAWPHTERLAYTLGDSVRWRVINASADVHPMHLHGFYYRIDARGANGRDTVYAPAARRMVVTERLRPGETMQLVWSPDRPGGWVFHCHMTVHLLMPGKLAGQADAPHAHDAQEHTAQGMAGLILGIDVRPSPGYVGAAEPVARRAMRLHVTSALTPADSGRRRRAFVLQEGEREPAADSLLLPGSTLVLRRGEPTAITVVNRSPEPTSIHWHGLELESYYDGVVGVGGMPGARTPAVMPNDSFTVHITPPRTGTFMYHTHFEDVPQQVSGLYAPFLVLEPDVPRDAERELLLMLGNHPQGGLALNGERQPSARTLRVGERYRLRLFNITVASPNAVMQLMRDSVPVSWRALARDGFDLPPEQATLRSARQPISNGEIFDFEVTPDRAGEMTFEVRGGTGRLLLALPVRVVP